MNRRNFIQFAAIAAAAAASGISPGCDKRSGINYQNGASPWPICLNTSTIRPTAIEDKIGIAQQVGYDGLELWIDDLDKYEDERGNLKELGKKIVNSGLFVQNIIGLWDCMPMNDIEFKDSLPATRERMRKASDIGSKYIAAIPVPDREDFNFDTGIRRYKELLKIGRNDFGIIPAFEFVGFFKGINKLGEAAGIAIDTDDKDACLILDTFHLFRGGSGFNGIHHISPDFIANFHINDVSNEKLREELGDKDRIFPGDGIFPLEQLLKDLHSIGYKGPLSVELFNREHWRKDPLEIADLGLKKTVNLIKKAMA